jgi:hypothetical protein
MRVVALAPVVMAAMNNINMRTCHCFEARVGNWFVLSVIGGSGTKIEKPSTVIVIAMTTKPAVFTVIVVLTVL